MQVTNEILIYKAGIVFVDQMNEKAPVLNSFFIYLAIKPRTIIFINDISKNLLSVEKFAKEYNIEFIDIEYTKTLQ